MKKYLKKKLNCEKKKYIFYERNFAVKYHKYYILIYINSCKTLEFTTRKIKRKHMGKYYMTNWWWRSKVEKIIICMYRIQNHVVRFYSALGNYSWAEESSSYYTFKKMNKMIHHINTNTHTPTPIHIHTFQR